MTSDPAGSIRFYRRLFGWEADTGATSGRRDPRLMVDGRQFCGVVGANELTAAPNLWLPYVAVDDLDASVERVLALRGRSPLRNAQVTGSGRFAVITDPIGSTLALCEPGEDRTWHFHDDRPGGFCWHELLAEKPGDIATFYQELLGWSLTVSYGDNRAPYWYFTVDGQPVAGIRTSVAETPHQPLWLCHAEASNLERTVDIAVSGGGATDHCALGGRPIGRGALITDPQRGVLCAMVPAASGILR